VAIQDSLLLSEMIQSGRAIYVGDVRQDARFPALLEYQNFTWLGIPLIASSEVIGVIALEKQEADAYTAEHIQAVTTFAGQVAVGLENANLYQESLQRTYELDQHSQRLALLNRLSGKLSSTLDMDALLAAAMQELHKAVRCDRVSSIILDSNGLPYLQADYPHSAQELPILLPDTPIFEHLQQSLGVFYSEDARLDVELAPLLEILAFYQTRSILMIPMATGTDLVGMLGLHTERPYHFMAEEIELARTIANQAAIALQNARLFAETRSLTSDLEQRVAQRTAELAHEHLRTETLLRVITELSSSLDLEQVLQRTLRVLNEMIDAEQITVLISRPGEQKFLRLASLGYAEPTPSGGVPTPFSQDQGLAGWVVQNREAALINNVMADPRWMKDSVGRPTQHRSALAVPLMIGADALGVMMMFHRQEGHFSLDQLDLVQAAANQVAVAVNNAELYRLIRDQAEDLGSMLRKQQVETSRSKAILEAVADGVLVTDATMEITLFNASAEKILGLERTEVLGKSLEHFTGLFGHAAQSWRETIFAWSENPEQYQAGETYSDRINLENGSVVAVRLAPVHLRSDFLGTVSIFQDITHQVEVDRLKSEFVATVSHELRTPMTSIKGYAEIMLMGAAGAMNEQQKRFLEVIKSNTERLTVLVNDLLDVSRIEAGRVNLSFQSLNLDELAQEILQSYTQRAREENKAISISSDVPANLPLVRGDYERVRQILDNLIENAYVYNVEGGSIIVAMRPVGEEVQVDVLDTGMGIPIDEQPRIFERFFRGENPLTLGVAGTGLGLSIVKNVVQMHGGRIWVASAGIPGKGSTFSFTLPVYKPDPD
jgi:PAS domain S-box-containing protein